MRRLEFVADSGIHVGITLPVFLAERRRASNHRSTYLPASLASRYNRSVPVKASILEPCRHLWRSWRVATKCEKKSTCVESCAWVDAVLSARLGAGSAAGGASSVPQRRRQPSAGPSPVTSPRPVTFPCIWIFNAAGGLTLELVSLRMRSSSGPYLGLAKRLGHDNLKEYCNRSRIGFGLNDRTYRIPARMQDANACVFMLPSRSFPVIAPMRGPVRPAAAGLGGSR
jgi:hypothetical protein